MNPMMYQMNLQKARPLISQIRQKMDLVRNAQNPQAVMQQLIEQNPLMKQANDIAQKYNGDTDKAFLDICRQNGLDPNEIASLLK